MKNFTIGGLEAHPTKGYRGFARPKTNRRRRLIPTGACLNKLSREARRNQLAWDPKLANWARTRERLRERHA